MTAAMASLTEKIHSRDLSQKEFYAFRAGDQRVFEIVFNKYHHILYRYAFSILKCKTEAEDIVQTSFIRLYRFRLSIQEPEGVYPYLFVIAKRLIANAFKQAVEKLDITQADQNQAQLQAPSVQQDLYAKELHEILLRCMENLPTKQREVYRLSKLMGYTYEEISVATGSSKNTVKNQLISASRKIKAQIEKIYFLFSLFFWF
ncbi:MAG: RNA polymerase sigma factor [Sphingobacterium sp.]